MRGDVWIVLAEDRHADVEAFPFASEVAALQKAERVAAECASPPWDIQEGVLTPEMMRDGWVLWLICSAEGDRVRVVRRHMEDVPFQGPGARYDVTVYAPNATLWGRCGTCGQDRWKTEIWDLQALGGTRLESETRHCGCCAHPHTLEPGGYQFAARPFAEGCGDA